MADGGKKKTGGGKLARSETVTVRFDPKLKYLAELAARKQRRTLSSFIEWAIETSLGRVDIYEGTGYNGDDSRTVAEVGNDLWDVDDEDRFVKLALQFPDLLTHEEQILWKLIRENGYMWKGRFAGSGENKTWTWDVREASFDFEKLRRYWSTFNAVARGDAPKSDLPGWERNKLVPDKNAPSGGFNADDDIPF